MESSGTERCCDASESEKMKIPSVPLSPPSGSERLLLWHSPSRVVVVVGGISGVAVVAASRALVVVKVCVCAAVCEVCVVWCVLCVVCKCVSRMLGVVCDVRELGVVYPSSFLPSSFLSSPPTPLLHPLLPLPPFGEESNGAGPIEWSCTELIRVDRRGVSFPPTPPFLPSFLSLLQERS